MLLFLRLKRANEFPLKQQSEIIFTVEYEVRVMYCDELPPCRPPREGKHILLFCTPRLSMRRDLDLYSLMYMTALVGAVLIWT